MIPASFYWNDLGEWQTIWQESRKDQHGHSALPPGRFLALDSNNCLINAAKNKLVGLIGVNQLAIIDSPDALLICRLQDSYHVKHLVTQIVQSTKLKKFFL